MLDLSKLSNYVQEERLPLIHEATLKAKTAGMLSWQSDVKTSAKINLLKTDVTFQDGTTCGWSDSGSSELSQRQIDTGVIKINQSFCHRKMVEKWTQHEVRVNAGFTTLPFEEDFVNGIVADINQKVEKAIWQGDKSSADPNLNKFDGLLKIVAAESSSIATSSYDTGSAYTTVKNAYMALPQKAFERGDVVIFCGQDLYRSYVQELVEKNYFHYNPNEAIPEEYFIPGTAVQLVAVSGLNGTSKLVGGSLNNIFYGFDENGSENDFRLWYSEDNDEMRLRVIFNAGVQVAFPDEIVYVS